MASLARDSGASVSKAVASKFMKDQKLAEHGGVKDYGYTLWLRDLTGAFFELFWMPVMYLTPCPMV